MLLIYFAMRMFCMSPRATLTTTNINTNPMKMINDLRNKLESIGATLDPDTAYTLYCDAPSGYVWRATGIPCLSIHYGTNGQTWLAEELRDELRNLKMGLEKVTDQKELAEHRWNLGDDTWGSPSDAPNRIEWPKTTTPEVRSLGTTNA